MNRTIAGTDLPPSAVHAIIEIGNSRHLSSKKLADKLLLEKSTVSRLVRSLVDRGDVREIRSEEDARTKHLSLTTKGQATAAAVASFAGQQVAAAIDPLSPDVRQEIVTSLQAYSAALRASRFTGDANKSVGQWTIRQGYTPGLIARIVEYHALYYSKLVGFGAPFEAKVAGGLADFVPRLDKLENAIWYVEKDGQVVGSISIDGEDLGEGKAHLRWFFVEERMQGAGVGRALIQKATAFCDEQRFRETQLWTFKGLDAARSLYESHGFTLADEYYGDQWGKRILEQHFVRKR
ncbi:MAG: bifunctional helix-turn-helix transcriptional regulator/GNAT family N-acetyltransferase [Alphaproteobacteria bacterium]